METQPLFGLCNIDKHSHSIKIKPYNVEIRFKFIDNL